jgi:hypothetical protein
MIGAQTAKVAALCAPYADPPPGPAEAANEAMARLRGRGESYAKPQAFAGFAEVSCRTWPSGTSTSLRADS